MQNGFVLSENNFIDKEAATSTGCLCILLWPPFSTIIAGLALFIALIHLPLNPTNPGVVPAPVSSGSIASFFTPEVQYWAAKIVAWSAEQGLDPNLAATVMQIESCGDPLALSPAGAVGLFQVMPYHFSADENSFEPQTNAARGLGYLKQALAQYPDPGLALAAYNGGIHGASRPPNLWAQETRDYKYWGEAIYADATAGRAASEVLDEWLAAGGASLCAQAAQRVAGSY